MAEVIVVSATSMIEQSIPSTGTQVKEDQEWLTGMNIFAFVRKWPSDLLETKFDEFLRQTLPPIVLGINENRNNETLFSNSTLRYRI